MIFHFLSMLFDVILLRLNYFNIPALSIRDTDSNNLSVQHMFKYATL